MVLLAACEDLGGPIEETLPTGELVILRLQNAAPAPTGQTFFVSNARAVTRNLLHPDAANTLYLRIEFPVGSLDAIGGTPLGPTDSVEVTVAPRPNQYGFTISPSGLVFSTGALPRAILDYAVYGDRSVADGVPTYADRDAYSAALDLWTEISPGQWRRTPSSTPLGVDAVEGRAEGAGNYVVAAPR